ncbi:PII-like signaling protein [Streptomyces eurocidicus]|uniref:PII-like signaling protein n=1 Tax=Streptomyces eurocidicus TaxID=66423 RepID=A0A7W8B997_STREU|nr:PII-like signaling protein [Streptomyces eurocidicus]
MSANPPNGTPADGTSPNDTPSGGSSRNGTPPGGSSSNGASSNGAPAHGALPGGPALRLTVYLGESDTWRHRPLHTEIVHRAHAAGLAGASVFHGVEGFGASSVVHTARLLSLSEDLPVAVVIVDTEERVRAFLPTLDELLGEDRLVVLDEVQVVRRPGGGGRPA